jgi:hypothetical protein
LGVGVGRPQDSCEATSLLLFLESETQPTENLATENLATENLATENLATENPPPKTKATRSDQADCTGGRCSLGCALFLEQGCDWCSWCC